MRARRERHRPRPAGAPRVGRRRSPRLLATDPDAEVRRAVGVGARARWSSASAAPALAAALKSDADAEVREMAAWAIAEAKAQEADRRPRERAPRRSERGRAGDRGLGPRGAGGPGDRRGPDPGPRGPRAERVRATAAWALGQMDLHRAPAAAGEGDQGQGRRASDWRRRGPSARSATRSGARRSRRRCKTETDDEVRQAEVRALIESGKLDERHRQGAARLEGREDARAGGARAVGAQRPLALALAAATPSTVPLKGRSQLATSSGPGCRRAAPAARDRARGAGSADRRGSRGAPCGSGRRCGPAARGARSLPWPA